MCVFLILIRYTWTRRENRRERFESREIRAVLGSFETFKRFRDSLEVFHVENEFFSVRSPRRKPRERRATKKKKKKTKLYGDNGSPRLWHRRGTVGRTDFFYACGRQTAAGDAAWMLVTRRAGPRRKRRATGREFHSSPAPKRLGRPRATVALYTRTGCPASVDVKNKKRRRLGDARFRGPCRVFATISKECFREKSIFTPLFIYI